MLKDINRTLLICTIDKGDKTMILSQTIIPGVWPVIPPFIPPNVSPGFTPDPIPTPSPEPLPQLPPQPTSKGFPIDLLLLGFGLVLLLIPDSSTPKRRTRARGQAPALGDIGALPMIRGNRLYYLWKEAGKEAKSRPRKDISRLKRKAAKGDGVLYAVWAKNADDARQKIGQGIMETYSQFSGVSANCAVWDQFLSEETNRYVWRCLMYARACNPPDCSPGPAKTGKLRLCVKEKLVDSAFYMKPVRRCLKYMPLCDGGACMPEKMPKPEARIIEPRRSEVRSMAKAMAAEHTDIEQEAGPALARDILDRGGIAAYKRGFLKEEYKEIPLHLKNRQGLPLDQMASEMGVDEAALVTMIQKAYPKGRKTKRRFAWQDYEGVAHDILFEEYNPQRGYLGVTEFVTRDPRGEGAMLFRAKRELVLEQEDVATSDDPLEIHLQRQGWNIREVRELQESIAAKAVPDLFTGKKGKLTYPEINLQVDIEAFFQKRQKARKAKLTRAAKVREASAASERAGQMRFFGDLRTKPRDIGVYLTRQGWNANYLDQVSKSLAKKHRAAKGGPISLTEDEAMLQDHINKFYEVAVPAREPSSVPQGAKQKKILYEPTQETMFHPTAAQMRLFGDCRGLSCV